VLGWIDKIPGASDLLESMGLGRISDLRAMTHDLAGEVRTGIENTLTPEQKQQLGEVDTQTNERLAEIGAQNIGAIEAIKKKENKALAALAQGRQAEYDRLNKEAEAELAKLRAQLAGLTTTAANERKRSEMPKPGDFDFNAPNVNAALNDFQRTIEAQGTFSTAALDRMGIGSSTFEKQIAEAGQQTADNTRKMNDKLDDLNENLEFT